MKEITRHVKRLREFVSQMYALMEQMNFNIPQTKEQRTKYNTVLSKLEEYQEMYKKKEELSPEELQALMRNADTFMKVHDQLQKEIEYLEMSGRPNDITSSLYYLREAFTLFDEVAEAFLPPDGSSVSVKFTSIRPKKFNKVSYKDQVDNVCSELDVVLLDFKEDLAPLFEQSNMNPLAKTMLQYAYIKILMAWRHMDHEEKECATRKPEEVKDIQVPKEVLPQKPVPEAPETEQLEAESKDKSAKDD